MMIDQSTAFDLCDHKVLIKKLKLMGVEINSAVVLHISHSIHINHLSYASHNSLVPFRVELRKT